MKSLGPVVSITTLLKSGALLAWWHLIVDER